METQPATDEDLLGALRAGGAPAEAALGTLLTRHAGRLHRHFALQFRDPELAEDLVHDVFERVVKARERVPTDSGFRPWLWTVALNLGRNTTRKRGNAPLTRSLESGTDSQGRPLTESLRSPSRGPRAHAEQGERAVRLHAAIAALPEPQREALLLKHFDELPGHEVAAVLGVSEGTVWSRVHRALRSLAETLGPTLHPEGGDAP